MKRFIFLLVIISVFTVKIQSQVKIGDLNPPERGVILELKSDTLGFLPPRISLISPTNPYPLPVHVQGNIVFNIGNTNPDSLRVGLYYNTGTRWVNLSTTAYYPANWFYMPSIPIDVSGAGSIVDLYDEYKKQLNTAGNHVVNSAGAPAIVLATIPKATDLYYYVTAYDDRVFENITIDANGLMTYDIKSGASADDATVMNIVFVEK